MLNFIRLTSPQDTYFLSAMELYRSSFPHHEQRDEPSQLGVLSDADYHFDLIFDESCWVGTILYWENQDFIYVEHFCILPDRRNRNYGERALALLSQREKTVILEIDPPVDDISIRRSAFYQRAGYQLNRFEHIHPPYHSALSGHALKIMSQPNILSQAEYDAFYMYLKNRVMA